MARKTASAKKKEPNTLGELAALWSSLVQGLRSRGFRWLIGAGVIIAAAGGAYAGFGRLEQKVHALDRFDRPLTLEWEGLPNWLNLHDNRHILDSLTRRAGLRPDDRLLDPYLAGRLGRTLAEPDVGWVKSVKRIVVHPDGVVSVRCDYREPAAWFVHGRECFLVDDEGVRLPGCYEVLDCEGGELMMIKGVRMKAPEVGQIWRGADVSAGLKLARMLRGEAFRYQVRRIDVENHDGRVDRSRPHIELATDLPGSRIWWGRAPDEEFGIEIPAEQKVTLLRTLYDQWGRIDLNRSYVNIMTWPDRITLPIDPSPGRGGSTARP